MEELKRNEDLANQLGLPPTIQMAKNFVKAASKHLADKMRKVNVSEYKARLDICNKCELRMKNRCTHPACGCFIDIKAWWASEDCPDSRWPPLE